VEKLDEEMIEYYTDYLEGVEPIGLPKSRYESRLRGVGIKGSKFINPGLKRREKIHLKVLEHLATSYVNDHMVELREQNPLKDEGWVSNEHNRTFIDWFSQKVRTLMGSDTVTETIRWLARGPNVTVQTW
jgi:hypothetical protein